MTWPGERRENGAMVRCVMTRVRCAISQMVLKEHLMKHDGTRPRSSSHRMNEPQNLCRDVNYDVCIFLVRVVTRKNCILYGGSNERLPAQVSSVKQRGKGRGGGGERGRKSDERT